MTIFNTVLVALRAFYASLRSTVSAVISGLQIWVKDPRGTSAHAAWWLINTTSGRNTILQIFFAGAFIGALIWAFNALGLEHFDFGFIDDSGKFAISANFHPFYPGFDASSAYYEFFIVGIQNTLLVAILGIVTALILGFTIGILHTMPNFLVRKILDAYVEFFRNTPLLLQLFFWYIIVFLSFLPALREPLQIGSSFLNVTGLHVPSPHFNTPLPLITFAGGVVLAVVASVVLARWAKARQERTGRSFLTLPLVILLIIVLPILGLLAGSSAIAFDIPELGRFGPVGGALIPRSFFVLWFGLTVYTSAFVGENVRAGIEAVAHGQIEAGVSLGLNRWQRLRLITIPQAMRIIIPPTISQCLNLTKNSSLATIVSYPDLVAIWVETSLNQTGAAIVIMLTTFAVYMTLSLITSLIANIYNRRVQIAER